MKRILISASMIVAIAAVGIGATRAFFSDTATSTGNTFTAGTLDLNVDGGNTNVVKFNISAANPGQSGTGYYTLNNVGSLAGTLAVNKVALADDDNNCTEPESTGGDATCGPTGGGELSANLDVVVFVDLNHDGVVDGGDTTLYSGKLNAMPASMAAGTLAASGTTYVSINWSVANSVGNVIQSDSSVLDLNFTLDQ